MNWVRRFISGGGSHLQKRMAAGFVVLIPIGVTVVVVKVLFDLLDPPLQDLFLKNFSWSFPGMGVISLVIITYLMGLVATLVVGRRLIDMGHRVMDMIPVVKSIYGVVRQAAEAFSNPENRYSAVVLVNFPWSNIRSIALVTARLRGEDGVASLAIFVPTSPNPTSGFMVVIPEDQVTYTDLSVEDAMKVIISGGILAPGMLKPETLSQPQTVERRTSNQ